MPKKTKPYHYAECGLDYVYLLNGFERHKTAYGAGVSVENADKLDEVIAEAVVTSPATLCGQEVRFLRAMLDMSQAGLAKALGVNRVTVNRWENKHHDKVEGMADTALRLLYMSCKEEKSWMRDVVDAINNREDEEDRRSLKFKETPKGWVEAVRVA